MARDVNRAAGAAAGGDPRNGFDVVLRMLDHQIVGPDGQLIGNVDDLAMEQDERALRVTGLLLGPGAFGTRLPAWLGTRLIAIWQRLSQRTTTEPDLLPFEDVEVVGSAVEVNAATARRVAVSEGLETWLREHVVGRIPGAGKNPEGENDQPWTNARKGEASARRLDPASEGTLRLSRLLGADAVWRDGREAGSVVRVFTDLPGRRTGDDGPVKFDVDVARRRGLEVRNLLIGPRSMWLLMEQGDGTRSSGPPLLARALHAMSPSDHVIPWRDVVQVDWERRRVVLHERARGQEDGA